MIINKLIHKGIAQLLTKNVCQFSREAPVRSFLNNDWILQKINAGNNSKFQWLRSMKFNEIIDYYADKTVERMQAWEIYYYLSEPTLYQHQPRVVLKAILDNINLPIWFKCHFASKLRLLDSNTYQPLILDFNQNCQAISSEEVNICLSILQDFPP